MITILNQIANYTVLALLFQLAVLSAVNSHGSEEDKEKPPVDSSVSEKNLVAGSAAVTTNYVSRGISNSNNKPALQGVLTLNDTLARTGVYLSAFASNVHLYDKRNKLEHLEIDTAVGVANTIGENFSYDVHIVRYIYPHSKGLNYTEEIASAQFYFLTALVGYSANTYDSGKDGTYVNIGFTHNIPKELIEISDISLSGGIGYYKLPRSAGLRSYADYSLQVAKSIELSKTLSMMIALQWTNTNRNSIDPASLKRNHIFGTLTLNF